MLARTRLHRAGIDRAVSLFSRSGEHGACWLVLGAAGSALDPDAGRRREWRHCANRVALGYGINYAVKLVVRRRRPELAGLPPLTPTVSPLSFPSAHATTSFAAARGFSRAGLVPALPLYAVAVAFAVSRPYLGVHYPSDVVFGALLGTAVGSR